MCGSFCTFSKSLEQMKKLSLEYDILPIMSFNAASIDTRFGKAKDFINKIEEITGKNVIITIEDAEPIGPKSLTDIMLIEPCTGNTLAKLAAGITDTPVTMAVKSHLRGGKPVVLAVASNDGLSASAKNIGELLNRRNYFFLPLRQDNSDKKPTSLVADFKNTEETLKNALKGIQLQPVIVA